MRKKLLYQIDALKNLYYLLQYLRDEGTTYINTLRAGAAKVPRNRIPEVYKSLINELADIKARVGCRLSNAQIQEVVDRMTAAKGAGYAYISKEFIDKHWFENYSEAFPRWPHIPRHALVVFETDINHPSPYSILLAEEQLFDDAKLIWLHIEKILSDGKNFRMRPKSQQKDLYSYMRTLAAVTYHFLEAYLNGIAYCCFQEFHDLMEIEDHDLLSEWNSKKKRVCFVPFDKKLKDSPVICGKYYGQSVIIIGDRHLEFLLKEGKHIRDALTHPSPYMDWRSKDPSKTYRFLTINPGQLKKLLESAIVYVKWVERSLGHNIDKTIPWLEIEGIATST